METIGSDKAKVPGFDGKKANYESWSIRWDAFAEVEQFEEALVKGGDPKMPTSSTEIIDETNSVGKAAMKAKKQNRKAVAYYTLAFKNIRLLALVNKSKTTEWPGGLAWKIKEALTKKYRPNDIVAQAELRQRMNAVSMKKTEDPATLFEQLSEIEAIYNTVTQQITEVEMIAVILSAAPKEYHSILTAEQRYRGVNLTLDHLEEAMNDLWRQGSGKQRSRADDDEDNELALVNFGGKCFKCGKTGHKAAQCDNKSGGGGGGGNTNNKGRKFNGTCNNCGKRGHMVKDCWELEENKDKRPNNYRKKRETANAAVDSDDSGVEFLLSHLCVDNVKDKWDDGLN
ncbi:MAG: hypothetical protein ACREOZ_04950, partial [Gloeomargaritales cyanobacterium]